MSAQVGRLASDFALPYLKDQPVTSLERLSCGTGCRASTVASRYQAVERVILAIRERLPETLSLQTMAEIAILSPYHFNRVFRQITGIPPGQFLYALRLEVAKRLLLTTQLSVTDVCFEVGYNSVGTFTTRFTQLVGLSPRHLRRLAARYSAWYLDSLCTHTADLDYDLPARSGISGQISAPDDFAGLILVGLFPTPIPQSQPVGCAFLTAPGSYHLAPVPDGRYYLFATALPRSESPLTYLLHDSALRGRGGPLLIEGGQVNGPSNVTLRAARQIDPPLLVALPSLLAEHLVVKSGP